MTKQQPPIRIVRKAYSYKDLPPLLTTGDVQRIFKVSQRAVRVWANSGRLGRTFKTPGGHLRFYKTDVLAVLDELIVESEHWPNK